jgi:uncharacterized protein
LGCDTVTTVRDDELRNLIRERNPWWRGAASGDPTKWAERDPTLRSATASHLNYAPTVLDDVGADGGLRVLRGPRRVGKSVALKRLALRFCRTNDAHRLIYLAVDGMRTQDLRRAFTIGRALTEVAGDHPRLWLIDEVTSVPGWEKLVKELRDNTALADDGIVLTGSSAAGFEEAVRAVGAGRTRTTQPFRTLLPMTFTDVVATAEVGIVLPEPFVPDQLQSELARDVISQLSLFIDELDLKWQSYLESGGFPQAVADWRHSNSVGSVFVQDLQAWLATDVVPGEIGDSVSELMRVIHQRSGSPLSMTATAEALHMTRDRFRSRVDRLVGSFGAIWCHQCDEHGTRMTGSQSKLYLIDPILARLPVLLDASADPPDFTRSTEAALAVAFARSVAGLHPERLVEQRAVMYRRTGGGEVDFASLPVSSGGQTMSTTPIESKWVGNRWRAEARTLIGKYGHGIVATKDVTDLTGDVWAVPAPIVALMLNGRS